MATSDSWDNQGDTLDRMAAEVRNSASSVKKAET
jgi:hypothetical protein